MGCNSAMCQVPLSTCSTARGGRTRGQGWQGPVSAATSKKAVHRDQGRRSSGQGGKGDKGAPRPTLLLNCHSRVSWSEREASNSFLSLSFPLTREEKQGRLGAGLASAAMAQRPREDGVRSREEAAVPTLPRPPRSWNICCLTPRDAGIGDYQDREASGAGRV